MPASAAEPVPGAVLELTGVSVHLSGTSVLEDLDLTVPPGQTLTVLGGNGAGKSTFPRGRPSWPWPSVSTQPQPPLRH